MSASLRSENCSPSARNAVRVPFGISVRLRRNPQLVAGAGDLGSTIVSEFLALPDISSLGVTELRVALHHYARQQFGDWFQQFAIKPSGSDTRPARPDLNFVVAGFDLDDPKIYRMSSSLDFAPMLVNYGFAVDGVAQFALYLLNRLYDPASVMEDLKWLAAYIIAETASQDGKVGGAIQMATITTRDAQLLTVSAVEEIVRGNLGSSRVLRFIKNHMSSCNSCLVKSQDRPDDGRQRAVKIENKNGLDTAVAPHPASHPIGDNSTTSDAATISEERI